MKKILVLASNPKGDLKLEREVNDLTDALSRNIKPQAHQRYEVVFRTGVRPGQIQELLLEHKPQIVHFCGHGAGEKGLLLQDDYGREQLVSTEALARLFEHFAKHIQCSVFNACNSYVQAEAVVKHVDYAIGMREEIRDQAACIFAVAFYLALAYGESIENAYELGCNQVQLQLESSRGKTTIRSGFNQSRQLKAIDTQIPVNPEHLKPVLHKKNASFSSSNNLGNDLQNNLQNNLPPDFKTAIAQEIKRKEYKDEARDVWEQFGQRSHSDSVQPLNKKEYGQRKILLKKVKDFWIEGFLKPSLFADEAINLDLKKRPDALSRPFNGIEEFVQLNESFEQLQQTDIHHEIGFGQTLLILGEPGSGKTIALLQLAQRLVERTEQDLSQPVPVVFNLSSWGKKRQPIEKWLIEELQEKYQVPKTLSEPWIKQEKLILLLDGLDEVEAKHRNECVRALNTFITNHNTTEMVVCSRVKDYQALSDRLQLSSAICLQPTSIKQLYEFLENVGDSLAGLKKLLQTDSELERLARTPLILNIMSVTYQEWSAEQLLQEFRSPENRYQNLFDAYIERMLGRRGASQKYPKEKVKRWLTWLAKRMVKESQTVFLIEKMQPTWLNDQNERTTYRVVNSAIGGMIFGVLYAVVFGLLYSLISGVFLKDEVILGLIVGVIVGVVVGLIGAVILGFLKEITLLEQISWSWQRAKSRIIRETGFWLIVWLSLAIPLATLGGGSVIEGLAFGLLMAGLSAALSSGLGGNELEQKTVPNQGINSSAKNFAIVVLSLTLIFALIFIPIIFWDGWMHSEDKDALHGMLIITTMFGLIGGLRYGGAACIQHLNLRLILWHKNRIPWNYARFLDYAAKCLLIKKVGGGYVFYHRMLLEHFAGIKQVAVTAPVPVTPSTPVPNHLSCNNCGQENPTNNKFCNKCGTRLS